MIPIIERPDNADQWDPPMVWLDDYSIDEQIEYWRIKNKSVRYIYEHHPNSFDLFVKLYGEEIAEEILALSENGDEDTNSTLECQK